MEFSTTWFLLIGMIQFLLIENWDHIGVLLSSFITSRIAGERDDVMLTGENLWNFHFIFPKTRFFTDIDLTNTTCYLIMDMLKGKYDPIITINEERIHYHV